MSSETGSFRDARKAQNLRLKDVADRAGMSTGMVSMIENGLKPSRTTAKRMAEAIGRDPGEFWEQR